LILRFITKPERKFFAFLTFLFLVFILVGCGGGGGSGGTGGPGETTPGTINLAWDSNAESDLAGYKIYYGTIAGIYDHAIDAGNVTTYTLTGLLKGQTYFIVVTAYTILDIESDFSNQVSGPAK
jgi:hypothetical protein